VIARPDGTPAEPQALCLDKGYDYPEVYELIGEFGLSPHIRSRGEEKEKLKRQAGFRARRWVVERTHSWLNRFRGLLIRWSKKSEKPPRPTATRLRSHHVAPRNRTAPTGIGS
jgi:putative transposase